MKYELTNKGVKALGFVVPVNSQEINRDPSQHDGQANTTHHGLRVQREDEEEGPEEEVNNWPNETDLQGAAETHRCKQVFFYFVSIKVLYFSTYNII